MTWIPNIVISGQLSKAAAAIAEYKGRLHIVHLGDSSNKIWHSTFDGTSWTPNVAIPNQLSKASPALASFNGRLHMVHLGDSSNKIWHSTFDGTSWTPNVAIPNQLSKASPALASFNGRLHMVHLGDSSNNIWHSTFNGTSWTQNITIAEQRSKASPALALFNGRLHMAHLGDTSNKIWVSWLDTADRWTANVPVPDQFSQAPVALAPFGGRLHMVHIGNTSHNLWHSSSDGILSLVRVGAKILLNTLGIPVVQQATLNTWVANIQTVYATMGFEVQHVNTQNLNLPALLAVDVGSCMMGNTTAEQRTLFQNRNNLGANDIAVYFVDATVPAYNGCAAHPDGVPACIVVSGATQWTMAHECGHILGLTHVDNNDRLMTGNGTAKITNPPPDLTYKEGVTMGESQFSRE